MAKTLYLVVHNGFHWNKDQLNIILNDIENIQDFLIFMLSINYQYFFGAISIQTMLKFIHIFNFLVVELLLDELEQFSG